jgi:AraC-like DNA-binding protein
VPYDGENVQWENRRIHTANVVFGEALYEPGGLCGPRVQRDFQLVTVQSGDCAVTIDQTIRRLRAGAIYKFLPGGHECFHFSTDKPTHHFWCSVRPGFLPGDFRNRLRRAPFSVPCSELSRVLMSAVLKLRAPRSREASVLIEQLALSVLAEFLNCSRQFEAEPGTDAPVRAFLHYVEDHFSEEDCLQAAHKAAGISRNALISRFRQELHTTPARYLWRYRVERGAAMLGETGHTAAEIAYSCGFKNPFHFSRLIKQQLGASPKHLRSQVWCPGAQ